MPELRHIDPEEVGTTVKRLSETHMIDVSSDSRYYATNLQRYQQKPNKVTQWCFQRDILQLGFNVKCFKKLVCIFQVFQTQQPGRYTRTLVSDDYM